jgi:single-strand DNA-binding protein
MIEDQCLTIAGTVGSDVEVRFTPSGAAVCNFSVAVNHRKYNRSSGQWEEAGTDWWRINCWRALAENVGESVRKGDRVLVYGKVASRTFDGRDGQRVTTWEVTAEEVAHSMKFATTVQNRTQRTQAGGQDGNQRPRPQGQYGGRSGTDDDPWASPDPGYGTGEILSRVAVDDPPF